MHEYYAIHTAAGFKLYIYRHMQSVPFHVPIEVHSMLIFFCHIYLNLLLQGSRATRYYTYVFFTMNGRFNMCGV